MMTFLRAMNWFFFLAISTSLASPLYLPSEKQNEVNGKLWRTDQGTYLKTKFVPKLLSYVFMVLNVDEIVQDVKLGKTLPNSCNTCKFGIGMLQQYIKSGKGHDTIKKTALSVCKSLNSFSDDVCQGVISLFADQVIYVLERAILTSDEMCGFILGSSCATVINPFHNWTVASSGVPKPPVKPVPLPKPGSPVLRVLQLSDTHYDPYYMEGYDAECKDPLCCRLSSGLAPTPERAAGKWGDYRGCDSPLRVLENVLQVISKTHEIDYIIWTGDTPPHDIWNSTKTENLYTIRVTTDLIKKYFPKTPVFPAIGNHETVPVNSFPPPNSPKEFSMSWLYDTVASYWKSWLSADALQTLKKGGYYVAKVYPGLRIISLNNNYCNALNWWLLVNSTDPVGELQWLVNELQDAEDNNDKVHIIGHIPPGESDCLKVWSRNFYSIISRYEGTVSCQFYGHKHTDGFEIFYDENNLRRPVNVAYISPSVTTYGGVNPSYRIYTVDGNYPGTTYAILDHETYFMNLTNANLKDKPTWNKEYSAKQEYNLQSLNASEWNLLVKRLEVNDDLFQRFYRLFNVNSDLKKDKCEETCKDSFICSLRTGRSNDPIFCTPDLW